ncbi:DUF7489 domain-containing protein [Saccharothrix sp. Mg75]|uniref:DUF7489 domain-containing protein n=1 Tax=Saccharothrix sp. Mg75 TaxID=3445357 RepID=UPI003EEBFC29
MGVPVEAVVALLVLVCLGFAVLTAVRDRVDLVVRTDDDETISRPVSPELLRGFAVGDRVVKHPGQRWPTHV